MYTNEVSYIQSTLYTGIYNYTLYTHIQCIVQCTMYTGIYKHCTPMRCAIYIAHLQYTNPVCHESLCLELRKTNRQMYTVLRNKSSDERRQVKKHIKSGRDLCQFSSGDLEAKLGIRHVLHRKKVFTLPTLSIIELLFKATWYSKLSPRT